MNGMLKVGIILWIFFLLLWWLNHSDNNKKEEQPKVSDQDIFSVLQQVMGHADLKTSLTYLRGLEIQQLEIDNLPEL
jgi:hypothetical protein